MENVIDIRQQATIRLPKTLMDWAVMQLRQIGCVFLLSGRHQAWLTTVRSHELNRQTQQV